MATNVKRSRCFDHSKTSCQNVGYA